VPSSNLKASKPQTLKPSLILLAFASRLHAFASRLHALAFLRCLCLPRPSRYVTTSLLNVLGEPVWIRRRVFILGIAHPQLLARASGTLAIPTNRMLRISSLQGWPPQVLIYNKMTSVLSVMEDYLTSVTSMNARWTSSMRKPPLVLMVFATKPLYAIKHEVQGRIWRNNVPINKTQCTTKFDKVDDYTYRDCEITKST